MDPPTTSNATKETARLAKAEIDSTRDPLATCFNADLQEKRGEKLQAIINDGGSTTKCVAAKSKPLVADELAVTAKASSSLEGESHGFNNASKEKIPEGAATKAATAEANVTAARTAAEFEEAVSLIPGAIDESKRTSEQAIVVLKRLQQVIFEVGCRKKACEEAIKEANGVGAGTDAAKDIAAKASAEMIVRLVKLLKSPILSLSC